MDHTTGNTSHASRTADPAHTASAGAAAPASASAAASALLVIDVQESFRQRPDWRAVSDPEVAGRVARLVAAARERGEYVVWVLHSEPGTGTVFDPDLGHVRLLPGLEPGAGEPVLTKTAHNAFTTTPLQRLLTTRGVRALTVCGIRTEQCCETTARLAADLGYEVTFAIDATATTPVEHRDAPPGRPLAEILADPRTLTTAEIMTRTEYALAGRFATLRTVAELTAGTGAEPAAAVAAAAGGS
ncbi:MULTISPECIES: cysteine hydrolase family protein [Streptomyces]|uniref:Isochorismatase family protein n=1 Tax=Streptomyces xinghaiensis TaxID=1038928 RepID=A0A3R7G2J7_9ACTN|nr:MULTISPECIES: isochorismatase family protein [Streptomyces]PQM25227.1 cysteine hydrolase [Streptomyces xinghaiensis]RKM99279.1 isochorismatase family protein [Streptomyces xinghaiensis]RNC75817.1 isochorismatase family protein [Streptomyces xinghaiensis]